MNTPEYKAQVFQQIIDNGLMTRLLVQQRPEQKDVIIDRYLQQVAYQLALLDFWKETEKNDAAL